MSSAMEQDSTKSTAPEDKFKLPSQPLVAKWIMRPKLYYNRILLGEICSLMAILKTSTPRWASHHKDVNQDPLMIKLRELQMTITSLDPDVKLDPNSFLDPFLAIIRSEDTTGPVTRNALAAVNRMLCYGLITPENKNAPSAVESIATAVTHARFVGTDPSADEVVLWEILTVLRTLMLSPVGHLLTNESVCEILNSSFRICFETRLSELLRNCTEDTLRHIIQLLFSRLPQFKDDPKGQGSGKKLKMRAGGESKERKSKSRSLSVSEPKFSLPLDDDIPPDKTDTVKTNDSVPESSTLEFGEELKVPAADSASVDSGIMEVSTPVDELDISHTHLAPDPLGSIENIAAEPDGTCISTSKTSDPYDVNVAVNVPTKDTAEKIGDESTTNSGDQLSPGGVKEDFVNSQGVKFTQEGLTRNDSVLMSYGIPCIKEVFRFLIYLTNPTNEQNTPGMILTALNLITVSLEVSSEYISKVPSLLAMIKNQLCRNLFFLLKPERKLPIFMASLRICTLLFESLRTHIKFQFEMFLKRICDIILSEAQNISYCHKGLALEAVVQLWKMPGLVTELFINFDCDLYSTDVFEELTKILSKNVFPVQGLYSNNLLSLEALTAVIDTIYNHSPSHKFINFSNVGESGCDTKYETTQNNISLVSYPLCSGYLLGSNLVAGLSPLTPVLEGHVILRDSHISSRDTLKAIKEKKRLLAAGSDQFNVKPEKGIQFLQDNGILGLSNEDIALFLKENPLLEKKVIGEYMSKKKNVGILSAFVKSFDFRGLRIDESLRLFLETFRLPGEAPLISIIIEHFSTHWHTSNGEPFGPGKEDAAFTLAYAVIMLNVDQHNQNAKKQNIPMTLDDFRRNLRGVNDSKDFDQEMLEDIYSAICLEEIVMPAEQSGLVKENYLWKMLLRRGSTGEGNYLLANDTVVFDKDLFALCWSPTIASLSYVFDKSVDDAFLQKALSGFNKCAAIAARYGMSDVFDNLVISLCKFTTLMSNTGESLELCAINFGSNRKAQLAARTVFRLIISHGDILREGWRNVIDLLLQLFRYRLLPSVLVESEDFVESSGKVSLLRATPAIPRVESGLLSSLYIYISLGDSGGNRGSSPEDIELMEKAKAAIADCHPEKLITESAFLCHDALHDLLGAIIDVGNVNNLATNKTSPDQYDPKRSDGEAELDEYCQSFLLELSVSVLIANKDRAVGIWPVIRDHLYSLLMGAVAADCQFLLERCIVTVLKIAKVLLRKPELANPILQSLRMLLVLKPHTLARISVKVIAGIFEVLSVNADNIHDPCDWAVIFTLLECVGAGAKPLPVVSSTSEILSESGSGTEGDGGNSSGVYSGHSTEQGSGNESFDLSATVSAVPSGSPGESTPPCSAKVLKSRADSPEVMQSHGGWILVGKEGEIEPVAVRSIAVNEWDIVHQRELGEHRPEPLVRAVDTLSFLVREKHISCVSLPSAVQACRTFVEATINGGKYERHPSSRDSVKSPTRKKVHSRRKDDRGPPVRRPKSPPGSSNAYDADESDSDDVPVAYQQISEKLLDLMDTLHTSTGKIVGASQDTDPPIDIWQQALCPLLQGIARYCCDIRPLIRNLAMNYLQRALLNHDLQALTPEEWESCFNKVLFPLLANLLQPLGSSMLALEESRVRAATLVQKVYLRHLTPLLALPTFTALWLTILDFMDKYLNTHRSDNLCDAIPEILKNMLLVMETTQVFHTSEGFTRLWTITWDKIDSFLPDFRFDLFKSHPPSEIHRIEVVPSVETGVSEVVTSCTVPPPTPLPPFITQDHIVQEEDEVTLQEAGLSSQGEVDCPSLREQNAVRLSLSNESLPQEYGVIIQPPLPSVPPANVPESPPSESEVNSVPLSSFLASKVSQLHPLPPVTSGRPHFEQQTTRPLMSCSAPVYSCGDVPLTSVLFMDDSMLDEIQQPLIHPPLLGSNDGERNSLGSFLPALTVMSEIESPYVQTSCVDGFVSIEAPSIPFKNESHNGSEWHVSSSGISAVYDQGCRTAAADFHKKQPPEQTYRPASVLFQNYQNSEAEFTVDPHAVSPAASKSMGSGPDPEASQDCI